MDKKFIVTQPLLGDIYCPIDYNTALPIIWPDLELYHLTWLMSSKNNDLMCNQLWYNWNIKTRRKIRSIHQPMPFLKKVLLDLSKWIRQIPLHNSIHGFVKGRDIVSCIKPLLGCRAIYAVDIKNAFPSITQRKIFNLHKKWGLNDEVSKLFSELATYHNRLPIGSPYSPIIFNYFVQEYVVYPIIGQLESRGCLLSIYADNIYIGFPEQCSEKAITDTSNILTSVCKKNGLSLHDGKINRVGNHVSGPLGLSLPDPEDIFKGDIEWPTITKAILRSKIEEFVYACLEKGIPAIAEKSHMTIEKFINKITGILSMLRYLNRRKNRHFEDIYDLWRSIIDKHNKRLEEKVNSLVTQTIDESLEDEGDDSAFEEYYKLIMENFS